MAQTVILRGEAQRRLAHQLVDRSPPNAVISFKEETRNADQNALLWSALSDISRAKPNGRRLTPEAWKAVFMHAVGHAVRFEEGLNGEPFPVGFRSSRLTKKQFGDLLDFVFAWGAENGIRWSSPDDR